VLGGAILATLLLSVLKRLLSLYLTQFFNYAAYGAVGAVLALLTWIYLASQVVFFGAEFTHVFAERYGSRARPKSAHGGRIILTESVAPTSVKIRGITCS
jgi:membrane protein